MTGCSRLGRCCLWGRRSLRQEQERESWPRLLRKWMYELTPAGSYPSVGKEGGGDFVTCSHFALTIDEREKRAPGVSPTLVSDWPVTSRTKDSDSRVKTIRFLDSQPPPPPPGQEPTCCAPGAPFRSGGTAACDLMLCCDLGRSSFTGRSDGNPWRVTSAHRPMLTRQAANSTAAS